MSDHRRMRTSHIRAPNFRTGGDWRAVWMVPAFVALMGCSPFGPPAEVAGARVAILIAEGFHDAETLRPKAYLERGGAVVTIIGPETGAVTAYNSDLAITIEQAVGNVDPDDFDALVIPGGRAPKVLQDDETVVDFVRAFVESGKVTAAICHGPLVLAAAEVLDGREVTGYRRIEADLTAAGAEFRTRITIFPFSVQDANLVTARIPWDLRVFNRTLGRALAEQQRWFDLLQQDPRL